jgi:hypothetical protein
MSDSASFHSCRKPQSQTSMDYHCALYSCYRDYLCRGRSSLRKAGVCHLPKLSGWTEYVNFDSNWCKILALTEPYTAVAYLGTFFSVPRNAISFIFFITSSLACDAVLVSKDNTFSSIPLTTLKGVQIHRPVQRLLDTDSQMVCVPRPNRCVSCRRR